jgi:NAD-dependent SIR2 family protein deacetylase
MAFSAHKDAEQLKERECDAETLKKQAEIVANLIQNSKHVVFFTGAGISTSAGIPDFRGPKGTIGNIFSHFITGVWTMRAQGKQAVARVDTIEAFPTLTHMAMVKLQQEGKLQFVIRYVINMSACT